MLDGHKVDALRAGQREALRELVGRSWRRGAQEEWRSAVVFACGALGHKPVKPWPGSWFSRCGCARPSGWSASVRWRWTAPSWPATPPSGANRTVEQLEAEVAEILRQAAEADQRDEREHGDARGDELPAALASKASRLQRPRVAKVLLQAEAAARQQRYEQRVAELAAAAGPRASSRRRAASPGAATRRPSPRRLPTSPTPTAAWCTRARAACRAQRPGGHHLRAAGPPSSPTARACCRSCRCRSPARPTAPCWTPRRSEAAMVSPSARRTFRVGANVPR
jgi:hypothetical protein